jgi:hypothetical protein
VGASSSILVQNTTFIQSLRVFLCCSPHGRPSFTLQKWLSKVLGRPPRAMLGWRFRGEDFKLNPQWFISSFGEKQTKPTGERHLSLWPLALGPAGGARRQGRGSAHSLSMKHALFRSSRDCTFKVCRSWVPCGIALRNYFRAKCVEIILDNEVLG